MSLMEEYVKKQLDSNELEKELLRLIAEYNKEEGTYLLVYAADIEKSRIPNVPLEQSDFYVIHDLLAKKKERHRKIDVYLETPGGRGETAEEIVRFLHNNFDKLSFVVSGEAKSAGTIMVLSGDEILMTETGSLGPIDAQIQIGRYVQSAYDYVEWIKEKREQAEKEGRLNPVDAIMIAQITPGELSGVNNALNFAKDLVIRWLPKHKFKNWSHTETRKMVVTEEMKDKQAKTIAAELTNHSKWRSHGRSIKIDDLAELGLKVRKIETNAKLGDIVFRIQTVCRLLFDTTTTFKIFATEDNKIFRQATSSTIIRNHVGVEETPDVITFKTKCPKCGVLHSIYAKLEPNPRVDKDFKEKGFVPFPKNAKLVCKCGFEIDLSGIRNEIEMKTRKKISD